MNKLASSRFRLMLGETANMPMIQFDKEKPDVRTSSTAPQIHD